MRKAACDVLKILKHPCAKRLLGTRIYPKTAPVKIPTPPPPAAPVNPNPLEFAAIPKYLVYRHFFGMINALDEKPTVPGGKRSYRFAEPFGLGGMQHADLDAFRDEAKSLTRDLAVLDEKAKAVVTSFRQRAKLALQQGQSMPPEPPQIYQLQALRDALTVHHMVNLQAKLGEKNTAGIEATLAHLFTAHQNLGSMAHPPIFIKPLGFAKGADLVYGCMS